MQFKLAASGPVSECREALNEALGKLQGPHRQEFTVVRAVAHFIVEENLDPLYVPWVESLNALRAGGISPKNFPPEPTSSFSIEININVEEIARH